MRLLLDTHTFIWFIGGKQELSFQAKALILDPNNEVVLSVVSLWEIAIKVSLGKLSLIQPYDVYLSQQIETNGITLLNIAIPHITALASLPFHHRDPFDRMIVTQALVEQIPIISRDAALDAYGITRLW